MKKIYAHWISFFVLFFGIVAVSYFSNLSSDIVIIALLALYAIFQGISIWNGFRLGREWFASSIIVQAMFAVCSPLYYSNFGDPVVEFIGGTWLDSSDQLDPCHLCWWARIMMFPILPLSIIYASTKNKGILWYIYLVTFPGICLELFHYILQKPYLVGQDNIPNPFGCTAANPCAAVHVDYFGIFTIPFLCLLAFLIINIVTGILLFSKKAHKSVK